MKGVFCAKGFKGVDDNEETGGCGWLWWRRDGNLGEAMGASGRRRIKDLAGSHSEAQIRLVGLAPSLTATERALEVAPSSLVHKFTSPAR